jgi:hypothetical protein
MKSFFIIHFRYDHVGFCFQGLELLNPHPGNDPIAERLIIHVGLVLMATPTESDPIVRVVARCQVSAGENVMRPHLPPPAHLARIAIASSNDQGPQDVAGLLGDLQGRLDH